MRLPNRNINLDTGIDCWIV